MGCIRQKQRKTNSNLFIKHLKILILYEIRTYIHVNEKNLSRELFPNDEIL
jgi:hypothetical protein